MFTKKRLIAAGLAALAAALTSLFPGEAAELVKLLMSVIQP